MRRFIGALVVAAMATLTLVAAGPASAGSAGRLSIKSAKATTPGLTTQIEVHATADYAITQVTAALHVVGTPDVIATVEGFELVEGTPTDGVWRSPAVTVPEGRVAINVLVSNTAGGSWHFDNAGVIDNGRDVSFGEFDVGPTAIDADHEDLTYHGRVVTSAADGTEEGVPHVTVKLIDAKGPYDLGYTSTDDEGRFSATAKLTESAYVYAVVVANATFRSATSDQVGISHKAFATRVTINVPEPSVIGETMKVTGRLERQNSAGDWIGLGDAYVRVDEGLGTDTRVPTAPDGTYTAEVVPQVGLSQWGVQFLGVFDARNGFRDSSAISGPVWALWRSHITGFNASPEPVGTGAPVTVAGTVLRTSGTGAGEPAGGVSVMFQFSADGKNWADQFGANADAHGVFSERLTAKRDGYWRAVVDDVDYVPAAGPADYVDTRYRTRVTSFNAAPEPVGKGKTITVSGGLQRYTSAWKAYSGQSVKIYFQAKGGTTWTYEGTAKTSSTGHFSHGFKAAKDGTWRVTYAGSSSYLAVTGPGDYVDVR